MINDLAAFTKYGAKISMTVKAVLSQPVGAVVAIVPVVAAPALTTAIKALILLGGLFALDFITGIAASWIEFKRTLPLVPGSGKRYVIQSSKLRLSAVKFVTYGLVALVARGIEWVFVAQEFEPHASLNKMTLTTMAIGFCCIIEAYSIIFENVKRMGFDIVEKAKKIYKKIMSTKKEFTE